VELHAIKTGIVKINDDLARVLLDALEKQRLPIEDRDVLAITSKVISTAEGRMVRLGDVVPSEKAKLFAREYSLRPEFAELVLREADRVYGGVEKAVLTLKNGVMAANAGIDNKNAPDDYVVLWPADPKDSAGKIRKRIMLETGKNVAVLVVDSGLVPLRVGTTGLALAVAGFKPVRDWRGSDDLFGRKILITRHAIADDLACAAHLLMGEAAETVPAVLVRGAPVEFSEDVYGSADMMMLPEDCIFMGTFNGKKDALPDVGKVAS